MRRIGEEDPLFPVEQRIAQAESQLADLHEASSSLSYLSAWDDSSPREFIGLAHLLAEGSYINFTRPANTPFLVISVQGGLMNVDAVVDSTGDGTHTALFGTSGALEAGIATGGDYTIWVCPRHSETLDAKYDITELASQQRIVVLSGGRNRPVFTCDGDIGASPFIDHQSATSNVTALLRFEGLSFDRASGNSASAGPFFQGNGGYGLPLLEFYDVTFEGDRWTYLFDFDTASACIVRDVTLDKVHTDATITAIFATASNVSAVGKVIIRDCDFQAMTSIQERDTSTDVEVGDEIIITGNLFRSITGYGWTRTYNVPFVFTNNIVLNYSGTSSFLEIGTTASSSPSDATIDGNYIRCSADNNNTRAVTIEGGGTAANISICGNSLRGPGGSNIHIAVAVDMPTSDCLILNSYRDWTTNVGGTTGPTGTGGDHGALGGLDDDDHLIHPLLAGRAGGQTLRGGTLAAERLKLRSTAAAFVVGRIEFEDPTFAAIFGGAYQLHITNDSPGGYWRLGESSGDFLDSSGNSNTGLAQGSITYGVTGTITGDSDTAITLDGSAEYIVVTDDATLDLGDGPFTLEAWVKRGAGTSGQSMTIVSKGTNAYQLRFSSTDKITLLKENVSQIVSSTITITDTDWHHIVATKNGAASLLYIDGVDVTDSVSDATMGNTGNPFHIGRRVTASDEFFEGSLDEVAVYPSALTPTQVLAHYNTGTAGRGIVSRVAFDSGDFLDYSQTNNYFSFNIADTEYFRVGGTSQLDFFNGSILETTRMVVTSDGDTVTLALDQSGGGDLTLIFSDGFTTFDTTPAATVVLTPGGDTSPQTNYVYILQSNKTLTVSISGWPSEEHAPIAVVILQSAATTQTENALVLHVWHDHVQGSDEQGHYSHLGRWIRQHSATYESGVAQTLTITTNVGVPDNVDFATTSGEVYQMHLHTVPVFNTDTGTNVHVVNYHDGADPVPYTTVTDLADLLIDSAGGSMSGKYFNLVIWASISEGTDETHLFLNLPSGSYNKEGDATDDVSGFTDFTIPDDFKGTAFLISRLTMRHQAASGGTWTSIQETDLRGLIPNLVAGGGTSAITTEFADNAFKIFDESNVTRLLAFQLSEIEAGNTRTLTIPDASGVVALTTVDALNERTANAGVTIENVTNKDGSIELHHGTDTIASDEITSPTGGYIIAAAQAGTTDDLDGIGGGANGRIIVVRADAGDTITVRHNDAGGGAGRKILLNGNSDIVLVGNDEDSITLMYDESLDSSNGAWFDVSRSGSMARNIFYSAREMSIISGATGPTRSIILGSYDVLEMPDSGGNEVVGVLVSIPDDWDGISAYTIKVHFTAIGAPPGGDWSINFVAGGNTDGNVLANDLDSTHDAVATPTVHATLRVHTFSDTFTPDSTDEFMVLRLFRRSADVADDCGISLYVLGMEFEYMAG